MKKHSTHVLFAFAMLLAAACSHRTEAATGAAFESASHDIETDTHSTGHAIDHAGHVVSHKVERVAHAVTH